MPRFVAPVVDERSALLAFLAKQRAGLRYAVHGLTDDEAWSVPSASELSLAGLLKHAVRTERRWVVAGVAGRPLPGLWPITDLEADFRREPGDTVAALLDQYAEVATETEHVIEKLADLGSPCALEQAAHWSARWVLFHLIEETARHAGHADVIRQTLDGKHAAELMDLAEEVPQ